MALYDDLNLQSGQYIEQYTGVPLEEVRRTADVLSDRHYRNLAALTNLQLVAEQYKSKMLPGAKSYVDDHINNISAALQDLARSGGENATARVGAITNKFLGDQGVLSGLATADAVRKEIELENSLLAQGKTPIRRKGVRETIMQAPILDPKTGALHSLYSQPYQSTVAPYEDPVPQMENIWKVINPDSIEGQLKGLESNTLRSLLGASMGQGVPNIPMFFESLTAAGISGQKIARQLDNAWSSYQQTPAYKQAVQYSENPESEQIRQKDQFYRHGMLRVFNNISRQYVANPIADDLLRAGAGKDTSGGVPTLAPGQPVESIIPYSDEGTPKTSSSDILGQGVPTIGGVAGGHGVSANKAVADSSSLEFHPQYLKDYKTMLEIQGKDASVDPGSTQAKQAAKEYRSIVEYRVSRPWVMPFTKDQILQKEPELQRQFGLLQYMDPRTGEVIEAFDKKGNLNQNFVDLTGGDPTKFRIESSYDAKNHYTLNPAAGNKFVRPIAVVSEDSEGKPRRFLASQLEGDITGRDVNTNKIYTAVNLRPGQWSDLNPRVKARELYGNQMQLSGLTPEDIKNVTMPIEATVDGETFLFNSPEHLSDYLLTKGIQLTIQ